MRENRQLMTQLKEKEDAYLLEREQLIQNMSSSSEFSVKMRELRAQIASLKLEKNTLQDDRDRSETLFRAKIESLEKTILDLRQEKESQIQYAERAQKWLDTL